MITVSMAYAFVEQWHANLKKARNESQIPPILLGMKTVHNMANASNPQGDLGTAVGKLGEWVVVVEKIAKNQAPMSDLGPILTDMEAAMATIKSRS